MPHSGDPHSTREETLCGHQWLHRRMDHCMVSLIRTCMNTRVHYTSLYGWVQKRFASITAVLIHIRMYNIHMCTLGPRIELAADRTGRPTLSVFQSSAYRRTADTYSPGQKIVRSKFGRHHKKGSVIPT